MMQSKHASRLYVNDLTGCFSPPIQITYVNTKRGSFPTSVGKFLPFTRKFSSICPRAHTVIYLMLSNIF